MLLAYDDEGNIIATLDMMVARDDEGRVAGLIDFAAHEEADGAMLDVWKVERAKGSKVWPEFLGGRVHEFRVELDGPPGRKRIKALIHRETGHRRERDAITDTGAPGRPLLIDTEGKARSRQPRQRPDLPLVREMSPSEGERE